MSKSFTLVLDAGTARIRCHIFDKHGRTVASSSRSWQYRNEPDAPQHARSFDVGQIWDSFIEAIRDSMSTACITPNNLEVIAVTSQRQGVAFIGDSDEEIYVGPNTDLRAVFEGGALDQDYGERIYQTTGHIPSFLFAPAKLRWFQLHRPEAYAKISCVLGLGDWLAWKLTGTKANAVSLAGEVGLLDIHKRDWCNTLLSDIGFHNINTQLTESSQVIGGVNEVSSKITGLVMGTPVVIAGADTQCGLLGMGVVDVGQVGIVAGWSAPLQMVTARPLLSPHSKTWAGCHVLDNRWVLESSSGDMGNTYRWVADNLFDGNTNSFEEMNLLADNAPLGSDAAVAFLGSQQMDMSQVGMRQGGFIFPVPLTFSELSKGHLVRATLESMAYSIKANLEQIEELSDGEALNITIGGGMTRTRAFNSILVNVLNREVLVSDNPDVTAMGAYLSARTAMAEYDSLEQASRSVRSNLSSLKPNLIDAMEYQDHYQRWLEMSEQLKGISL